jgi:hypothetical protein
MPAGQNVVPEGVLGRDAGFGHRLCAPVIFASHIDVSISGV